MRALVRYIRRGSERLDATRLPRGDRLLAPKRQRYDAIGERLPLAVRSLVERRRSRLDAISAGLSSPKQVVAAKRAQLDNLSARLGAGLSRAASAKRIAFARTASRLRPEPLAADAKRARAALIDTAQRARPALTRLLDQRQNELASQAKLLETLSYQATLGRGYAIVRDAKGKVLRSVKAVSAAGTVDLALADGSIELSPSGTAKPNSPAKPKSKKSNPSGSDQGSLF